MNPNSHLHSFGAGLGVLLPLVALHRLRDIPYCNGTKYKVISVEGNSK
jgi:hypothetical protein